MTINIEQVTRQCMDSINSKIKNLKKLNIIIIGKSGVGKSTLINSLFRGNFAETGLGKPVTQEIRKIEKQDYYVLGNCSNCHSMCLYNLQKTDKTRT